MCPSFKLIPLTQGKHAKVSPEDFERVSQFKWYAHKERTGFYARRTVNGKGKKRVTVCMARFILEVTDPAIEVDHINHNTLDNRRCNIRALSVRQNSQNRRCPRYTSKYPGVHRVKGKDRWRAEIKVGDKKKYLGQFRNEIDAHNAYVAELEKIGEKYIRSDLLDK